MRLTTHQIKSIQEIFAAYFLDQDGIWLFGSRADPSKKGGDIDLYIETFYEDIAIIAHKKIAFLLDLKKKIGDQKIDIVINVLKSQKKLPIYDEAKSTGVRLK